MTNLDQLANDVASKLKDLIKEYLDSLDKETEEKFHTDIETFEEVSDNIYEKIFDSDEILGIREPNVKEIVNNLPYGIVKNAVEEIGYDLSTISDPTLYQVVRVYLATQMLNDVLNEFV